MDNVVSASAAGDEYPTTRVLTADGVVSLIGCLMGNPYINAVYIGHPGWKAMGGRIGYSAATGIMVIALSWFGVISLMTAVIPIVAISPILLYIGMLIGSQAFQESPHKHAPAIVVALVPSIAAWGKLQIDNSLGAISNIHQVTPDMIASMKQVGVMYQGLSILGAGSILSGVVLGSVTTYIVDRNFSRASAFAAAGSAAHLLRADGTAEEVDVSRHPEPGRRRRVPPGRRHPLRLPSLFGGQCSRRGARARHGREPRERRAGHGRVEQGLAQRRIAADMRRGYRRPRSPLAPLLR